MSIKDYYESASVKQNKSFVATLVKLAFADNEISSEETALLKKISAKLSVSEAELYTIINNPIQFYHGVPYSKRERFDWLYDFVKMIEADHIIDQKELKLLDKFTIELGFDGEQNTIKRVLELVDQGVGVDDAYNEIYKD